MKHLFFTVFLILSYNSFAQKPLTIEIGANLNRKTNLSLSKIATSINYIALETNDNCILSGEILQIELIDNEVFLCDGYYIYRFDINGKLLKKIGQKGQGPGEYVSVITEFLLDSGNKNVTIYDLGSQKFITYNKDGHFVKEFRTNFGVGRIAYLTPPEFVAFNMGFTFSKENDWYDLFLLDTNGKIRHKYLFQKEKGRKYGYTVYPAILYTYNNEVRYKNPYEETIYMINSKDKIPVYCFNLGRSHERYKDEPDIKLHTDKKNASVEYTYQKEKISIYKLAETADYLYIYYIFNQENRTGVYDKKQKAFTEIFGNNEYGIADDINKGPAFWPKLGVHKNKMIDYHTAFDLIEKVSSRKVSPQLKKVLDGLKEDDNPVIVIVENK